MEATSNKFIFSHVLTLFRSICKIEIFPCQVNALFCSHRASATRGYVQSVASSSQWKFELCSDDRGMEPNDATSFLLQAHPVGPLGRWAVGPLGRWAVGPLMVSIICATGFVANAQGPTGGPGGGPTGGPSDSGTLLPGSDEDNGHWNMSSTWSSGSTSGTFGSRYSNTMDGPATEERSDSYSWDVPSGAYTDALDPQLYNQYYNSIDFYTMKPNYDGLLLKSVGRTTGIPAKAKVVATRQFTFTWVPKAAGSKPTKDLKVFIGGTATAEAYTQETSGASVKAWIGAQPEDQGEEAHSSFLDNVRGGKFFRVSKEQTSGTVSLSLGAQSSAPGDKSDRPRYEDQAKAEVSVSAQVDTRSLSLSRGGRYEHSKSENGEWHTYGDSIYSAHDASGFSNNDFKSQISIIASYGDSSAWGIRSDGTAPDITSSWSASGFSSTYEQSPQVYRGYAQYGTPLISSGNYSGSATGAASFDTSYTATDTRDGATTKAFYHLTLHDPVEDVQEEELSTYRVEVPMTKSGGGTMKYNGPRTSGYDDVEIESATSTETSGGISGTVDVSAFKELLGLSATADYTSTATFSVKTKADVRSIPAGRFIYRIALHDFQRSHKRFYRYDELGKIRRMITQDFGGQVYDPPTEVYHEVIEDTAFDQQSTWSEDLDPTRVNINNLPTVPAPPKHYDYSGGVS